MSFPSTSISKAAEPAVHAFGEGKAAMHPTHGLVQVTDVLPANGRLIKFPNPNANREDPQDFFVYVECDVAVLKSIPDPFGSEGLRLAHEANVRIDPATLLKD